jgi:hypothetical protein
LDEVLGDKEETNPIYQSPNLSSIEVHIATSEGSQRSKSVVSILTSIYKVSQVSSF